MELNDIQQLFYLTHVENLESIIDKGILSHSHAQNVQHKTIDMLEVQERRELKEVPGGRSLHDYANLYFSARNPMLYKRKDDHKHICVLRIKVEVLNMPGVVVATGNAASNYISFYSPLNGIKALEKSLVFARNWTDQDTIKAAKKRTAKCAEVLVPDYVPASLIFGAYVSCKENLYKLAKLMPALQIEENPLLFFLEP